jgi:hypothetical protein
VSELCGGVLAKRAQKQSKNDSVKKLIRKINKAPQEYC